MPVMFLLSRGKKEKDEKFRKSVQGHIASKKSSLIATQWTWSRAQLHYTTLPPTGIILLQPLLEKASAKL